MLGYTSYHLLYPLLAIGSMASGVLAIAVKQARGTIISDASAVNVMTSDSGMPGYEDLCFQLSTACFTALAFALFFLE